MKSKILLILFFIILQGFLSNIQAATEKTTVKVGISNQNFSTYEHKKADFISENIIKITDLQKNSEIENIEANTVLSAVIEDNTLKLYKDEILIYETKDSSIILSSNAPIGIVNLNRKGTPAKYRGMIELKKSKNGDKFHIINIIDLDNYLKGSVPNEMPVSFGLEALKAQAIAAKNYVTRAKINDMYDVVDSTQSQVYYGFNSERDISNQAVEETKGIYALYNKEPISALYFSTSPGITDDWGEVFGSNNGQNPYPYLKSRFDNPNQKPLRTEDDVIEFYSKKQGGYDTNSPKFRWSFEYSKDELENIFKTSLTEQSKTGNITPKINSQEEFFGLIDIKPVKRSQSGKILELEIIAKSGTYRVKKELTIRKLFKNGSSFLPSANFYIETKKAQNENMPNNNIQAPLPNQVKETIFNTIEDIFAKETNETLSFKLVGGGYGHNVGMSQYGAFNLSKMGKKYPDILKHYYTGITLGTIEKTVYYNEYNISYKTDFYYNKNTYKNVYLYVKNIKKATEFPFKINNFEFKTTQDISGNYVSKMEITQYLKNGINTIIFNPLSAMNKGKTVEYRIEFQ